MAVDGVRTPAAQAFPAPLNQIIGHRAQLAQLLALNERALVPHAMLFTGPSGIGKRTVAAAFAAMLLGARSNTTADSLVEHATPEKCYALLRAGRHPDFHLVRREEGKREITVEAVRTLCGKLQLHPYQSACSVAVIDDADMMNVAAANALLMTLEEPSSERYLILVTDAPQRLPETIVSRCQQLYFQELADGEIRKIFETVFGPYLPDGRTIDALTELCGGTLQPLELGNKATPFFTSEFDAGALSQQLEAVLNEGTRLDGRLKSFFRSAPSEAEAASLASELASEKDSLPLVWQILRTSLRRELRAAPADQAGGFAELLEECLESERLCRERTLSPHLHLTSLLLKSSKLAAASSLPV